MELEYKFLINKSQYNHILLQESTNINNKISCHINYYYDTPNLDLSRKGITLRIRKYSNGETYIECKVPVNKTTNNLRVKNEYKKKFEGEIPDILLSKELSNWGLEEDSYSLFGELKTIRRTIFNENGITIFIDKSMYNNITDYELEIEFEKDQNKNVKSLLKSYIDKYGLQLKYYSGKRKRFLESLNLI